MQQPSVVHTFAVRYQIMMPDASWKQHKKPYTLITSMGRQAFVLKQVDHDTNNPGAAHTWFLKNGPCLLTPWGPTRIKFVIVVNLATGGATETMFVLRLESPTEAKECLATLQDIGAQVLDEEPTASKTPTSQLSLSQERPALAAPIRSLAALAPSKPLPLQQAAPPGRQQQQQQQQHSTSAHAAPRGAMAAPPAPSPSHLLQQQQGQRFGASATHERPPPDRGPARAAPNYPGAQHLAPADGELSLSQQSQPAQDYPSSSQPPAGALLTRRQPPPTFQQTFQQMPAHQQMQPQQQQGAYGAHPFAGTAASYSVSGGMAHSGAAPAPLHPQHGMSAALARAQPPMTETGWGGVGSQMMLAHARSASQEPAPAAQSSQQGYHPEGQQQQQMRDQSQHGLHHLSQTHPSQHYSQPEQEPDHTVPHQEPAYTAPHLALPSPLGMQRMPPPATVPPATHSRLNNQPGASSLGAASAAASSPAAQEQEGAEELVAPLVTPAAAVHAHSSLSAGAATSKEPRPRPAHVLYASSGAPSTAAMYGAHGAPQTAAAAAQLSGGGGHGPWLGSALSSDDLALMRSMQASLDALLQRAQGPAPQAGTAGDRDSGAEGRDAQRPDPQGAASSAAQHRVAILPGGVAAAPPPASAPHTYKKKRAAVVADGCVQTDDLLTEEAPPSHNKRLKPSAGPLGASSAGSEGGSQAAGAAMSLSDFLRKAAPPGAPAAASAWALDDDALRLVKEAAIDLLLNEQDLVAATAYEMGLIRAINRQGAGAAAEPVASSSSHKSGSSWGAAAPRAGGGAHLKTTQEEFEEQERAAEREQPHSGSQGMFSPSQQPRSSAAAGAAGVSLLAPDSERLAGTRRRNDMPLTLTAQSLEEEPRAASRAAPGAHSHTAAANTGNTDSRHAASGGGLGPRSSSHTSAKGAASCSSAAAAAPAALLERSKSRYLNELSDSRGFSRGKKAATIVAAEEAALVAAAAAFSEGTQSVVVTRRIRRGTAAMSAELYSYQ